MAISVIVSNFNGAKYLPRLLETLKAQELVSLEIVVVDRYSTDQSLQILAQHPDITVLKEPPETGLVAGYSVGMLNARHKNCFFCNEDMWFSSNCLALLERHIDLPRKVACVDPWQWSYEGRSLGAGAAQLSRSWNGGSPHPLYRFTFNPDIPSGCVIAQACAGAMMIHRDIFEQVGGWDTSFFLDYEDTDLAIRLWQHGWKTVHVPEAKVYHAVGGANQNVLNKGKSTVNKKRYICARANRMLVAWRSFSWPYCWLTMVPWAEATAKNVLRLRLRLALLDIAALASALERLPGALRFRRANRVINRSKPGERFFQDTSFRYGSTIWPT